MQGIILAWYLPGILKESRQVSLFTLIDHYFKFGVFQNEMVTAMAKLHPLVGKKQRGALWREDPGNFASGTKDPQGLFNISPAWFQQGHEVSYFSL